MSSVPSSLGLDSEACSTFRTDALLRHRPRKPSTGSAARCARGHHHNSPHNTFHDSISLCKCQIERYLGCSILRRWQKGTPLWKSLFAHVLPGRHRHCLQQSFSSTAHCYSNAYIAKQAQVNAIHANVRSGNSRPRSAYDELCRKLRTVWEELLPPSTPLHAVFVHGSLVAGEEQGFIRPEAGNDVEWVRINMPEFERRAAAGSEDMRLLVEECRSRGLGV